jgi:hypothetical protein
MSNIIKSRNIICQNCELVLGKFDTSILTYDPDEIEVAVDILTKDTSLFRMTCQKCCCVTEIIANSK